MRQVAILLLQSAEQVGGHRLVDFFRIRQIQVVHNLYELLLGLREPRVQGALLQNRARTEVRPKQHVYYSDRESLVCLFGNSHLQLNPL